MNLNELREAFIREYPDRAIYIVACCKYSPTNEVLPKRKTEFRATLWKSAPTDGIHCQVSAHTPDDLIAVVRAKLSKETDTAIDVIPEVTTTKKER